MADLRGNPLTIGFYPSITETRMVVREGVDEADAQEPFTLARADQEKDEKYVARLDMETRMLRRLYEMLVVANCDRLKKLDGLNVDKLKLETKDKIWDALIDAGICSHASSTKEAGESQKEEEVVRVTQQVTEVPVEEGRWQAEDSFA